MWTRAAWIRFLRARVRRVGDEERREEGEEECGRFCLSACVFFLTLPVWGGYHSTGINHVAIFGTCSVLCSLDCTQLGKIRSIGEQEEGEESDGDWITF